MKLDNNSNEMKTIVETFVVEETQELIYNDKDLTNWNELVTNLGLTGQNTIVKPKKSPVPFMYLKSNMVEVFNTLCPIKIDIKDYNLTPIPLEILRLISLSTSEDYFSKLEIWYDEKDPDPVCIGTIESYYLKKKGSWDSHEDKTRFRSMKEAKDYVKLHKLEADIQQAYGESKHYILGKWADVKHSFDELKKMAIKKYTEKETLEINKTILDAKRRLEDLKYNANNKFN